MKAQLVKDVDANALLDVNGKVWSSVGAETITLEGTPIGIQPTEIVRTTWAEKKIGAVGSVKAQAAHNGEALAFRLEWPLVKSSTTHGDNTQWPDGAAVAFPVTAGAALVTMGAPENPVNAWFWRADNNGVGRHVVAEGISSSETLDLEQVRANGEYRDGKWVVCIVRALQVESERAVVQLTPGTHTGFGVAIWDGSNSERAGIKAFSGAVWLDLELE
jgi:DMSO reductase family type II enzyme heme b subunit